MDPRQQEILDKLKLEGKLPTPKGVALELINRTQREDFSVHHIVEIFNTDPALTARVIKAANILLHNAARPVVSISEAVTVLGTRAVRQLVLGISLISDHKNGPCKQFDYAHFWSCSLLTGIAIRQLAMKDKTVSADEIFVVGLLADIGELAMTTAFPDKFGRMLESVSKNEIGQLFEQERDLFGFDHAESSAALMAEMRIPAIFQAMAKDYLQPETSSLPNGSREWKLMIMLHVASLIARICLSLPSQRGPLITKLRTKAADVAIEEETIIEVAEASVKDWLSWSVLFNMPSRSLPSFADLLSQAESESQELTTQPVTYANNDYKMNVLVVEDDRLMRALFVKLLTSAGHRVTVAANGVEALALIEKEHPQLVVTDWLMPVMDGITLCRELRSRFENRALYIIVVTAQESSDRLVDAFEAGADDYLIKPIIAKIFLARLRAAVRVVKLQEEVANDREQLLRFSAELTKSNELLLHQSLTDPLTGLPNRRMAMDRMNQEWATSGRNNRPLSCMMVDIDHFKSVNDTYGHQAGDEVLKIIAKTLRQSARAQDVVCRYGGEEFLIICPDTKREDAHKLAERIRTSIAALGIDLQNKKILTVTASMGLTEKTASMPTVDAMLHEADINLYAAKAGGRNRTVSS